MRDGHAIGILRAAAAAAAVAVLAASAGAEDWTQFRGSNRDGVSNEEILAWPPTVLWNASIDEGYASVVAYDRHVYAIGHDPTTYDSATGTDTVRCLDASTGQVVWSYAYRALTKRGNFSGAGGGLHPGAGQDGPRATPAVDAERLYVLSMDGHLFCFDRLTGRVVWYRHVRSHFGPETLPTYGCCASPLVVADTLVVDFGFVCVGLDTRTGAQRWAHDEEFAVFACMSPVAATVGGTACAIYGERRIRCVDVATGATLWWRLFDRSFISPHVVDQGRLFYSTYPDTGSCGAFAIGPGGTSTLWEGSAAGANLVRTYHLNNVATGGRVYAMDNSTTEFLGGDDTVSSFTCLDMGTGQVEWTEAGMGWANPVAVGDEFLLLKQDGTLVRASVASGYAQTGSVSVVSAACWTMPAVAGGRAYCRNYAGDLACLFIAPSVSVEASDPQALETTDTATFTIARTCAVPASPPATTLDVAVAIGGTGVRDTHYALSGGAITAGGSSATVTIPASAASVDVTVTALASADATDRTVTLVVQAAAGSYVLGHRSSAAVVVFDAGRASALPVVSVAASGPDARALERGPDGGAFTLTRTGDVALPLVVEVTLGGTAAAGAYFLPMVDGGAVSIPAGAASVTLALTTVDDAAAAGDATVTLTVDAGSAVYARHATEYEATVTIVDDDDALVDADADAMDDGWELCFWDTTAARDGTLDADADGLSDLGEYGALTDPLRADTDGDGSTDAAELANVPARDPTLPTSNIVVFVPTTLGGGGTGCAAPDRRAPGASGGARATWFALVMLAAALAVARTNACRARRAA